MIEQCYWSFKTLVPFSCVYEPARHCTPTSHCHLMPCTCAAFRCVFYTCLNKNNVIRGDHHLVFSLKQRKSFGKIRSLMFLLRARGRRGKTTKTTISSLFTVAHALQGLHKPVFFLPSEQSTLLPQLRTTNLRGKQG